MKIVVFGASGGTGRELVRQAVERGHQVTAFVRNPHKLPADAQNTVRPVVGDALDARAVASAVEGQDAVLSALGPRTLGKDPLLVESMRHILAAMQQHGVRRLIVLGASGVTPGAARNLSAPVRLLQKVIAATVLKNPFAAQRAMQEQIHQSDTDWTVVQPPRLLNSPGRGKWRVEADALPARGLTIARADVASFMLAQLSSPEWVRKSPYLSS